MVEQKHPQKWTEPTFDRECGSCYACCVFLGIEELKKWSGQACKHLDGMQADKRCSIYAKRPQACAVYKCVWREGFGPDNLQPNQSGMLITMYRSERIPDAAAATVAIIDEAKAKAFNVVDVVTELLMLHTTVKEVRLVNYKQKSALLFTDGMIYRCKLMPPDGYEALIFSADIDHPVGKFEVQQGDST
jgi:Fe-S-cluster containining protein